MIKLEDWNAQRSELHLLSNMHNRPNGIECPSCKAELVDADPNMQLASDPPKKAIKCLKCSYSGYRLA